jgi:hypothetical protein
MSSIRAQDEILQLLYWMKGERLGEVVFREEIDRFIQMAAGEVEAALEALEERKLLIRVPGSGGPAAWQLTDAGSQEGARRFTEELSAVLGHESHAECDDPECECREPGFDGVCENRAG